MMHASSLGRLGPRSLALGVLLLCACKDPVLEGVEVPPMEHEDFEPVVLRDAHDVDILFVVDDTSSMATAQAQLAAGFPSLMEVLESPEVAANYRIAFTTTDDGNPACQGTMPVAGALRLDSCRSRLEEFGDAPQACTTSCPEEWAAFETLPTAISGSDERRARDWIESIEGRTNLPEGLEPTQALQCASPQGLDGCGFESPLEAMWKALRRSMTDSDPAFGFVRQSSILSVVHVTDGTECSLNPDWEAAFLPEGDRVFWSDPEAEAPTAAVCWNAGVVCDGPSPYGSCSAANLDIEGVEVASADAEDLAVLRPVSRYIDQLQELESNKQMIIPDRQVLVSIIAGVASDGSVAYADAADPQLQQDFGIGPGCEGAGGPAVPPARLLELAEAFEVGDRQNVFSVCDDDYSPALTAIAEAIAEQILPACIPACVADADPETAELEFSCTVIQESPDGEGSFYRVDVPECEADGSVPADADSCYEGLTGAGRSEFCSDAGFNLELRFVRREGVALPEGSAILFDCELSDEKALDCPDLP
jgi:hypothetical protein